MDRLFELIKLIKAYKVYGNLSCFRCKKMKYVHLYKQIYSRIVSGNLSPKELIKVQRTVFNTVLELQSEEGCEYFIVDNFIYMFRMLINIALQIYVIGVDPYFLVGLNEDQNYKNELFNQKEIEKLLFGAEYYLKKHKNQFIIISDLCLGNLQFGDWLVNDNGAIGGVEVKSGEKNKVIGNMVLMGEKNPYDKEKNKTDWKHFDRVKKQWDRGERILQQIQSEFYINFEKNSMIFPYWIKHFDNYEKLFSEILVNAGDHLYKETKVDDSITIITINRHMYRSAHNEIAPPCLLQEYRGLLDCAYDKSELAKVKDFYSSNDSEGTIVHRYNEDTLFYYSAPQPYLWGASGDLMVKLYEIGLEIYIKIDIDALFVFLKSQGFSIYPQKKASFPYLMDYKKKMWIIEYKDFGPEGITAFTNDHIERLTSGLYTSKGLADYLKLYFEKFKKGIELAISEGILVYGND